MSDDPSSSSASSSSSSAGGGQQSSINQAYAAAITRAEELASTAQRGPYAPAFVPFGITAAYVGDMLTKVANARSAQTTALAADAAESGDVDAHEALRAELVGYMQQAQAWARAAFFFSNPARLAVYHIGEDLNANLPSIGQFSLDVRTAGVADALAGFTTAYLAAYDAARAALFGPVQPVTAPEPDDTAVDLRDALERMVEELKHEGMRILFVADGVWPHWKEGSAGPRHAFGLPPDRPYAPPQPEAPVNPPTG